MVLGIGFEIIQASSCHSCQAGTERYLNAGVSAGVEHLNTFQRLMSEFKRRISETLNFTSTEQMSWNNNEFYLEVKLSEVPLQSGIQPHTCTWHLPNLHCQLVANGHWAAAPHWNLELGGFLRNLQIGHVTP